MITYEEYVGKWAHSADLTDVRVSNITDNLLPVVNAMYEHLVSFGVKFRINPSTGSKISGQTYGGFRPQNCPQGAPHSSHKEGLAVDIYDPENEIDNWLMDNQEVLKDFGVYIEHPDKTNHWSHWSVKPPGSGKHVFYP